jgi:hypothetical protein
MKRSLAIFPVILLLAGCVTQVPHIEVNIPAESEQISLEPLQVKIDYEAYLLRIDLIRQSTKEEYTTTDWEGKTVTEKRDVTVPYNYLGVDLGNGLFLDAHNNLSISILKLLGIDREDDFKIVSGDAIYEKTGNIFKSTYGNTISSEITLNDTGATIVVPGGVIEAKANTRDIIVFNDEITYKSRGALGDLFKTRIMKIPGGAVIPSIGKDREITLDADGSIDLRGGLLIKPTGKSLYFDLTGGFGTNRFYFFKHRTYFLKRSKNKLVYYGENLNGITIDISENAVTVTRGRAKKVYEYEIIRRDR